MLLSAALWWPTGNRTFPALPIHEMLHIVPVYISWALSSLLFTGCILFAMGRLTARVFLPIVLVVSALLCVLDLNRLQVWLWLWILLWVVDWADLRRGLQSGFQGWVIAGVYVLSGFFKLTPWFSLNFDWFCEAFAWTKPFAGNTILNYATGLLEMSIGAALLWPATRYIGKWMATVLHLYILMVLGPLGHQWNMVVWPWNIAMIALVWSFFRTNTRFVVPFEPVYLVVGLVVWVMPLFNIGSLWPETMSWKMYSNTHREAVIISENGCPCSALLGVWPEEGNRLLLDDWAYKELHVPPFSSRANFENGWHYVQRCSKTPVKMEVLTVGWWSQREQVETFPVE